jgi:TatD DNase family protein
MTLIDTHAHLNDAQFDADRPAVLERAAKSGVLRVIEIADHPSQWEPALDLARRQPERVLCAWGFHPHYAHEWKDTYVDLFREKATSPLIVALGEIGLDYVKSEAPAHIQQRTFRKLIELATSSNKPVVLHCREAHADLFPILEKYWKPRLQGRRFGGVLHCFSGGREEALRAVDLKLALGVDGPVTYPKNDGLRDAILAAGLDNLVLETDSPYLPPQSSRGKRNEPGAIREIAAKLADLFKVPFEDVARRTSRNAQDLFGLPPESVT